MVHRHANRLIEAAEVVRNLGPIGPIPQTESQARPLAQLEPEVQREVWRVVMAAHHQKFKIIPIIMNISCALT